MSELSRVLKPGSWGILMVPVEMDREETYEDFSIADPAERSKHFGQIDHVSVYGKHYFDRLGNAGFSAQAIDYFSSFDELDKIKMSISTEPLILVKK